jgi:hypothetical protein
MLYIPLKMLMIEIDTRTELELETPIEDTISHVNEESIINHINEIHPQIQFPTPALTLEDIWCYKIKMYPSEEYFAELLLERGIILFREPKITKIANRFDFYAYNPQAMNGGILIEITTTRESRRSKRKKEQIRKLVEIKENYGINGVVLYREHLLKIGNSCCEGLLSVI